jgi:uncharacterized protein YdeI (YjbR/CyaY-like superfamily)
MNPSKSLDKSQVLYVADRRAWRAWLKQNHRNEKEVWLAYSKKHTGKTRIAYNDAVEEALCFGWIDSTVRTIDADTYAQRFSPRKPGSRYSQANVERLRKLIKQGKVLKDVIAAVSESAAARFRVPPDILAALQEDKEAWKNFKRFSPSYVRIRVAFIEGARNRPAEFRKRLGYFVRMSARNKIFGFGGIEKHY